MGYPAYYGRPAMVARYRRRSAPASVHIVALFQYLGALLTLAAAALAAMIARGATRGAPLDRVPANIRTGLTGAGLVIAVTLGVLGLLWLLVARKLQRGRPWARFTVVALSLLSIAGTGYNYWLGRQPDVLAGLALPLLYLTLLSTHAARAWFRGNPERR
jgi:uncharacterized BrkB/YihY/UPF0761 family membrane protein